MAVGRSQGPEPAQLNSRSPIFDLHSEIAALKSEASWHEAGRNAKTLVKHRDFRLVLIGLRPGVGIPEHSLAHCVTIQTLTGNLHVRADDNGIEAPAGSLVALAETVPYGVEAIDESFLILSLGWAEPEDGGDAAEA
jgi:quercetin dioxygenase-like cupin family protein